MPRLSRSASQRIATPLERMARYVALLYSILLPDGRLRMAAWRELLEAEGLTHVRTALSTGNAVFETERTAVPRLEARLEAAYERAFGRRVNHIVRTSAAFQGLVAANPFPVETHQDPGHVAVRVMRKPLKDADLAVLSERATPREKVAIVNGDLWLYSPEPPGTSRVVALLSRERSGVGTIRTWGTIRRLGEMLED
jgi:uncharacterized protein (DUF1697 family)